MNPSDPPPLPPPEPPHPPPPAEAKAADAPPEPEAKPPLARRVRRVEADHVTEQEIKRRQRLGMLIVLFAVLVPVAGCGLLFAVCAFQQPTVITAPAKFTSPATP